MGKVNIIGLDAIEAQKVADELNLLLANFQIYYQGLRGLHWNIKGKDFFELHLKFEELYVDMQDKIDLVAERILTLGHTPFHSFTSFLQNTSIKEVENITIGKDGVKFIIDSLKTLLTLERKTLVAANNLGDEGTITLITEFMNMQEKQVWMFNAWLQS